MSKNNIEQAIIDVNAELSNITSNGAITKRVILTQAEYDALDPKVATTEYIIVEEV